MVCSDWVRRNTSRVLRLPPTPKKKSSMQATVTGTKMCISNTDKGLECSSVVFPERLKFQEGSMESGSGMEDIRVGHHQTVSSRLDCQEKAQKFKK